ncbi:DUF58 domain-containing protein [Actinoplanes regularis]|uniref:Uncharacterized conserved protein, DUF58 family, contains vWF domain n=1 Tax=Actinoplanes regularis TaxID=52697 RepID=A0A238XEY3_9ACTN|nr:DUF58 domain-containing protein [Actinoplanes regularis]GIE86754.1 hypothetical protein Are01nite_32340 [Actinoplanes regularis]GLW31424.1 hypothetical protein Areg01_43640 [Actinoplanes regularis]SNR57487.1 Uncharacterized conserved protein, DUF58 family, contains vWF domain [Actinoplanes regularis]
MTEPTAPSWAPTRALGRSVLLTGLLLLLGVALGRVDLVLLAAPFAIGAALNLRRRPQSAPEVTITADEAYLVEGGAVQAGLTVANADVLGYDLVVVRTRTSPWLRLEHADRPFAITVPSDGWAAIDLPGEALRWGRHDVGPAAARAAACGGLLACRPVVTAARGVRVYPVTEPFKATESMPAAAGLVGAHRSRRLGEGGELAGVRQFAPGDRLRRIDWRVSLRTRDLHVASTLSDRDAEVLLLLDLLGEVGVSGGVGGSTSVLDTTVRAAAAVAEHYLHRGDRVSLLEYGATARRLRAASGRRQYLTVLEWLLDVRADPVDEQYEPALGAHHISTSALVVVLTPLIDPRAADMLAQLTQAGRYTVAVDTLPEDTAPPVRNQWTPLATRLWRIERENVLGRLREHGVPVVAWAGAGSLDLVLRDVARMAAAPRGR